MRDVGARRLEDLIAYQFASEFKLDVYALLNRSQAACRDFAFRGALSRGNGPSARESVPACRGGSRGKEALAGPDFLARA